ncbi:uncharacterized protein LOC111911812 [Lactuca sativa]|uniref:uncharacterized protein LOC111911812 n=1 Tax=Lactuca sativa TaxID=4236 RepID=UPI000CD83AFC|nr:uncharacterized protein LOC111911812 [Lactuca sativa]
MAEQEGSHTREVGGGPQPGKVNTPVSPREKRLLGKLTDKANYASTMLVGEALVWWEATYEALNEYDQENLSWEMFKTRLLEKYCSLDMRRRLEKEFLELKQEGMTVNEYETQFNQRARFATKYILTEDDKIQLFLDGLRYEIRDFVANQDVLSFDKAESMLESHPRIDQTVSVTFIPPTRSIQSDSNTREQSQSSIHGRDRSQSFSIQSPSCRICGRNHPGQCKIDKESVVYYGCGEIGHIRPACPRKDVTCYACGITGHKKRFWPTLTSQMAGSQASVQQGKNTPKEEVLKAKGRAF